MSEEGPIATYALKTIRTIKEEIKICLQPMWLFGAILMITGRMVSEFDKDLGIYMKGFGMATSLGWGMFAQYRIRHGLK